MTDLTRKRDRALLPLRADPYWQRLAEGAYLGFRRGPDTWIARFRGRERDDKGRRKQLWQPLGEALAYDEAKQRAEEWLSQLSGSGVRAVKRDTVRAALETYLMNLRRDRRVDAAAAAEGRFKTAVYSDALASLSLENADKDDFLDWRDRLREGRQPRTVDRLVRAVVAGLNKAHELGHVGNPASWRMSSLPDDDERETAVFLTPGQRKAIIAKAEGPAATFFRGLELTGARPSELAAATVADFDGERLRLSHRKGRPPKLRPRYVELDSEAIAFFDTQKSGKRTSAPLFTEDGEQKWRRHIWAEECRDAIAAHNRTADPEARVPAQATAYSFRHARISELLQVYGIDPLTVAQQTGTSVQMIERAYFRFISSAMRKKLDAVKASQ